MFWYECEVLVHLNRLLGYFKVAFAVSSLQYIVSKYCPGMTRVEGGVSIDVI